MNTTIPWTMPDNRLGASRPRDRLCVARAIVDGVFVSALFWLALLMIVR